MASSSICETTGFEIQTRVYVTALRGLLVWVARRFAFVPGDCWKFWESWRNNMLGSLLTTTMNRAILNGTVFLFSFGTSRLYTDDMLAFTSVSAWMYLTTTCII